MLLIWTTFTSKKTLRCGPHKFPDHFAFTKKLPDMWPQNCQRYVVFQLLMIVGQLRLKASKMEFVRIPRTWPEYKSDEKYIVLLAWLCWSFGWPVFSVINGITFSKHPIIFSKKMNFILENPFVLTTVFSWVNKIGLYSDLKIYSYNIWNHIFSSHLHSLNWRSRL